MNAYRVFYRPAQIDVTRELAARPTCSVCRKPVERFEETFDTFLRRVRFTAHCHGDVESVDLSEDEASGLVFRTAFNRPAQLIP